jgi:hypothetical protein
VLVAVLVAVLVYVSWIARIKGSETSSRLIKAQSQARFTSSNASQ